MSKVESKKVGNKIVFKNFVVLKKSDTFYGVYQTWPYFDEYPIGEPITSGDTLLKACKKAKLLQIGFDLARTI